MRKTKYDANTFPLLAESCAREGMVDEDIANKLGISTTSYYEYQNRYPEFAEAIKKGKRPVDIEVENTLLKRALGYTVEEKITEVKIDEKTGQTKPVSVRTVTKHIQPEVGAIAFWLKNRMPNKWRDRRDLELKTAPVMKSVDISNMTHEEAAAFLVKIEEAQDAV